MAGGTLSQVEKQKNAIAEASRTTIQNIKRQGTVNKKDYSHHFRLKSFLDSRDKIIKLSTKSGLR